MSAHRQRTDRRAQPGMTLIEVIIALTLLAIIGTSLTKLLTSQVRFADTQIAAKDAREVSRTSLNMLSTDIRMVDADSGIVLATNHSFSVLAPYAEGVVCGTALGGGSTIALVPYDSASYSEGGYAGYAYIDTTTSGTNYTQEYQYKSTTTGLALMDSAVAATIPPCKTATDQFRLFMAVTVQPAVPAQSRGQAAFLFRNITYALKPSVSIPGTIGLFRRVLNGTRGDEELMAPFSATAQFMYLLNTGATVPAASGSTLTQIRGIQLQLNGVSEHIVPGASRVQSAPLTTTIFFKNRPRQ